MKHTLCYSAVLVGSLLLQGCGGGGLIGGPQDKNDLKPVPQEVKVYKLRPSASTPTLTTKDGEIFDSMGQSVQLRGINMQFTQAATVSSIAGIKAIKDAGSNTVHLYINENTTDKDLEIALAKVVEQGMLAIITLTDGPATKVIGQDDYKVLEAAVNNLWLDKWLGVIAQDRFQPHIMINIADSWGPKGTYDPNNGYSDFMRGYKVVLGLFRQAGLKVPLVIDAPFGDDYYAFANDRAQELMAVDDAKNLVVGIKAGGKRWDSLSKMTNGFSSLKEARLPYVVDSFGGSELESDGLDHLALMQKAVGDSALGLNIPWEATDDSAAYVIPFKEPMELINGVNFITNLYLPSSYLERKVVKATDGANLTPTGKTVFAMYVRDVNGNALRVGSVDVKTLGDYQWNRLSFTMPKTLADVKPVDYLNGATTIDFTKIKEVGIQLLANGKEAKIKGVIKLDDLEIYPGSPPPVVTDFPFTASENGWSAKNATASIVNGNWAILPTGKTAGTEKNAIDISLGDRSAFDFARPLVLKMRVFIPAEYASELPGAWIAAYAMPTDNKSHWDWQGFQIPSADFKAGEWSDIKLTMNVKEITPDTIKTVAAFGIQLGMNADTPKTAPILIDNISVTQQEEQRTKLVTTTQYKATFTDSVEGFVNAGWDYKKTTLSVEDGVLLVNVPKMDEAAAGTNDYKDAINKSNVNAVAEIDVKGNTTIKMKIFIPADWAGKDFTINAFMQNWSGSVAHYQYAQFKVADLEPGAWKSVEIKPTAFPAGYNRGSLNMLGFQFERTPAGIVKFDDIEIIGETKVPDSLPLYTMSFDTQAEVDAVKFDFAGGALVGKDLSATKAKDWKIAPFGWTASTWFGNTGANAVLNISNTENLVDLTARGDEIVNYPLFGIKATSVMATFPPAPVKQ